VTVFLGGGFAAKYLQGGGNFSVPLQWMLGLRRLKVDAIWLEHMPSEGNFFERSTTSSGNYARTDSAGDIVCFTKKRRTAPTISMRFGALGFQNANCSIDWRARMHSSISVS